MTLKIIQWTTGNVARQTVRGILANRNLKLVGVFAYSAEKVGKDVAELCNLPEATGITATNDIAALLALKPDCVVYTPLHFNPSEVSRLLEAGVNVVTTAEFLSGRNLAPADKRKLELAASNGQATLFGSGMHPGFTQLLTAVATNICTDVRKVTLMESVDVSAFAGDSNMNALGWGRPKGDPRHPNDVRDATLVFADGIDVLADLLGFTAGSVEPTCRVDFAYATRDLDLPGRFIAKGSVAGIDLHWEGIYNGKTVIDLHERWLMGTDIEPPIKAEHAYLIEVDADPQVRLRLEMLPDQDLATLTVENMHEIGMRITGMPSVNAIPAVCAAAPGIRNYAGLPAFGARMGDTVR